MGAGLERDVCRRTPRELPRRLQCVDLGVGFAGALVPSLADDLAVADDDTADPGVRAGAGQAECGLTQGCGHEAMVFGGEFAHGALSFGWRVRASGRG